MAAKAILEAENVFQDEVALCMRGAGFEYWGLDQAGEMTLALAMESIIDEYVQFPRSEAEARARGFGFALALEEVEEQGLFFAEPVVPGRAQNQVYLESLSDPALKAYATEKSKCEDDAIRQLDVPFEILDEVGVVEAEVVERLKADSDWARLTTSWMTCMERSGLFEALVFPIEDPQMYLEAQRDVLFDLVDPENLDRSLAVVRQVEIETAVASEECLVDLSFFDSLEEIRSNITEEVLSGRGL